MLELDFHQEQNYEYLNNCQHLNVSSNSLHKRPQWCLWTNDKQACTRVVINN